jgi:hypothetical protein
MSFKKNFIIPTGNKLSPTDLVEMFKEPGTPLDVVATPGSSSTFNPIDTLTKAGVDCEGCTINSVQCNDAVVEIVGGIVVITPNDGVTGDISVKVALKKVGGDVRVETLIIKVLTEEEYKEVATVIDYGVVGGSIWRSTVEPTSNSITRSTVSAHGVSTCNLKSELANLINTGGGEYDVSDATYILDKKIVCDFDAEIKLGVGKSNGQGDSIFFGILPHELINDHVHPLVMNVTRDNATENLRYRNAVSMYTNDTAILKDTHLLVKSLAFQNSWAEDETMLFKVSARSGVYTFSVEGIDGCNVPKTVYVVDLNNTCFYYCGSYIVLGDLGNDIPNIVKDFKLTLYEGRKNKITLSKAYTLELEKTIFNDNNLTVTGNETLRLCDKLGTISGMQSPSSYDDKGYIPTYPIEGDFVIDLDLFVKNTSSAMDDVLTLLLLTDTGKMRHDEFQYSYKIIAGIAGGGVERPAFAKTTNAEVYSFDIKAADSVNQTDAGNMTTFKELLDTSAGNYGVRIKYTRIGDIVTVEMSDRIKVSDSNFNETIFAAGRPELTYSKDYDISNVTTDEFNYSEIDKSVCYLGWADIGNSSGYLMKLVEFEHE